MVEIRSVVNISSRYIHTSCSFAKILMNKMLCINQTVLVPFYNEIFPLAFGIKEPG